MVVSLPGGRGRGGRGYGGRGGMGGRGMYGEEEEDQPIHVKGVPLRLQVQCVWVCVVRVQYLTQESTFLLRNCMSVRSFVHPSAHLTPRC